VKKRSRSFSTCPKATFALKAGVWFRGGLLLIVSPDSRAYIARCQADAPLIVPSEFPGAPLCRQAHRLSAQALGSLRHLPWRWRICLGNNDTERALRGFALGRKSWLFAGSDCGADRAAFMMTFIMTAKLNLITHMGQPISARRKALEEFLPRHMRAGRSWLWVCIFDCSGIRIPPDRVAHARRSKTAHRR
jgi:hypothetical protein